jgi:hypothetical protein
MSHIVTIKTELRDAEAVAAACRRLGLAEPTIGTAQLYSGSASGLLVQLPEWRYPLVIDTASGQASLDDFGGYWGDPVHLNRLLQAYAAEKIKLDARRAGKQVSEQTLADGSLKLTVQIGGAA